MRQQRRQRQQTIDRPVTDAFVRVDGDWRVEAVNDRAATLLGRPADVLEGRVLWDEVSGVADTDLPETLHRAVDSGRPHTVELDHRPDATLSVTAYPTGDGVAITMDERESWAGDRRRDRRRAAMVAVAETPAFALNAGGRFVDVNDALVDLSGHDREELIDSHVSSLVAVPDDGTPLREVLARGEAVGPTTLVVETATGDRRRCRARLAPDPTDDGGLVCAMTDRTTRRRYERRLAVLDRVLETDLEAELDAVYGRADAVRRRGDADVSDAADEIAASAQRLLSRSRLARRFAGAVSPEAGDPRRYDAVGQVRRVVERVREDRETEIRLVIRDEATLYVEESALLALEELIGEVAAETDDRYVVVAVATAGGADGDVRVSVSATDLGLSAADRAALTGDDAPEADLAAWLVRWAITESGGDIEVERRGRETAAVAALPRAEPTD